MKIPRYETMLNEAGAIYAREVSAYHVDGRRTFTHPEDIAEFFADVIGIKQCAEEHVYIACMNTRLKLVGVFEASAGSVNTTLFPVREIFQKALLLGSVNIAICHNHPSGVLTPSRDDMDATKRIKEAGDILGVSVVDHIIVGANTHGYYSFKAQGAI